MEGETAELGGQEKIYEIILTVINTTQRFGRFRATSIWPGADKGLDPDIDLYQLARLDSQDQPQRDFKPRSCKDLGKPVCVKLGE